MVEATAQGQVTAVNTAEPPEMRSAQVGTPKVCAATSDVRSTKVCATTEVATTAAEVTTAATASQRIGSGKS